MFVPVCSHRWSTATLIEDLQHRPERFQSLRGVGVSPDLEAVDPLVGELLEVAFSTLDLDWKNHTVQDERFMRPAEVDLLVGDASKAGSALGWEPEVSFEQLVQMMVEADYQLLKNTAK